ncbi:NAD(P)-dependent oxidoreductase [Mycoplasmopsis adleri]|uniref:NAD(P)-dependent oxidoreductase n=1 Tax=Mycoplasmopsis adleri TaxID=51362 RepID=UPI00387304C2
MKITAYSVRKVEGKYFLNEAKKYAFDISINKENLNSESLKLAKDSDAVIIRADSKIDETLVIKMHEMNIKYLLTRTTGVEHIDISACKKYGIKVANVPSYSPSAISEWAFSCALSLSRRVFHFANKAYNDDLLIDEFGYAYELKGKTVGIIGLGNIGLTSAKYFLAFNSKVIAFDPKPSKEVLKLIDIKNTIEEVVEESDIVIFHCPYVKGVNDNLINLDLFKLAKLGSIFINASRGLIQNEEDILYALKNNLIYAYATDVLKEEKAYFNKKDSLKNNPTLNELKNLYPRFILTPHIGSYTHEAVLNMVKISFENLHQLMNNEVCKNEIC